MNRPPTHHDASVTTIPTKILMKINITPPVPTPTTTVFFHVLRPPALLCFPHTLRASTGRHFVGYAATAAAAASFCFARKIFPHPNAPLLSLPPPAHAPSSRSHHQFCRRSIYLTFLYKTFSSHRRLAAGRGEETRGGEMCLLPAKDNRRGAEGERKRGIRIIITIIVGGRRICSLNFS